MIENRIHLLPLGSININRGRRQRSTIDPGKVEELAQSIRASSLIHAIVVDIDSNSIVAGEHRLAAFAHNRNNNLPCTFASYKSWTLIPVRFAIDCSPEELEAIELEENIKRTDMEWKDKARAMQRFHRMNQDLNPEWLMKDSAERLGHSQKQYSIFLQVATALEDPDSKIQAASGMTTAYNMLTRQQDRAIADEVNLMAEVSQEIKEKKEGRKESQGLAVGTLGEAMGGVLGTPSKPSALAPAPSIRQADFHSWLASYSGPKFNFLHCDFPYGINHQKSDLGGATTWEAYDDSPDIYWNLCQDLFSNLDKILLPSAHIVFWFSMNYYNKTLELINTLSPDLTVNPFPLIWHKTDNKGIIPDHKRGGRRTYETAFFITRGDRLVTESIAISYAGPGKKEGHLSEKSEPMLNHFFRMIVDSNTKMLDPTCGSGSALRAAEHHGAASVLGLELDSANVTYANDKLWQARKIRALQKENL